MLSNFISNSINIFRISVLCFSLLSVSCSHESYRVKEFSRKPASLSKNLCKKFVQVFFRYKPAPPEDFNNDQFFYYVNLDIALSQYRKKIDYESANKILTYKKLSEIKPYLSKKGIPFPSNEAENLAFHIRLSEAFGGEKLSITELFDKNSGRNFLEDLGLEIGALGKKKTIKPELIRKLSRSIFDYSNPNPYGIFNVLKTKHGKLQNEMIYKYAYDSIVDQGLNSMTKKLFFFNRSSAIDLHNNLAKRKSYSIILTKTFKVIGNLWKIPFGKGRKNIFFGGKALPREFIELAQSKGLRHAFQVFEDQIYSNFKSARRKQLVWVYASTIFATGMMYLIGNGIYHNFISPAFNVDELDIDVSGDDALNFMMKVWQVDMYKRVGVYFEAESEQYKKAKEELSLLSSEDFASKYQALSQNITEEELERERNNESYEIDINIDDAINKLMDDWQKEQFESYDTFYDSNTVEYKARLAHLKAQYPRNIQLLIKAKMRREELLLENKLTKKKLLKEIMVIWLAIYNGQGSQLNESSSDYINAKKYYESQSFEKLLLVKEELSDL